MRLPALILVCATGSLAAAEPLPEVIEFNRDIRPILADTCFQCHGPDAGQRKAKLRLDQQAGAFAEKGGVAPFVPRKPMESEAYQRIISDIPDEQMPPPNSQRQLSARQKELIGRWIEQGADWQQHWAFIPPKRPALPEVKNGHWPANGIDRFILARLESEELKPSPPAEMATLLRRVALDLTGLPPTPAEVAAVLEDKSPRAYEQFVDRLLASPRYGERMAFRWLDAARYADTSGYQSDGPRTMWRWRDWVIEAYNRNLPFDQFTIEQLAGDLLPNATLEQRIATGFNRNHRGNAEGGSIPEEFQVEYVVDRVDTTATVWMGLTLGCARCHDHKYDPFSQKEFYQLYAFFNNIPEFGRALKYGNSPPFIKSPTRAQQKTLTGLDAKVQQAQVQLAVMEKQHAPTERAWRTGLKNKRVADWVPDEGLMAHYPLGRDPYDALAQQRTSKVSLGKLRHRRGAIGLGAEFNGRQHIDAGDRGGFNYFDRFSFSVWVKGARNGAVLTRTRPGSKEGGWGLWLVDGKVQVNFVERWLDDALRLETEQAIDAGEWTYIAVTYDGRPVPERVRIYMNGRPQKLRVNLDLLNQDFYEEKQPLRIGGVGGPIATFRGMIDEVRLYDRVLRPAEAQALSVRASIQQLAAAAELTGAMEAKLRLAFRQQHGPAGLQTAYGDLLKANRARAQFVESLPTTMVMAEMSDQRPTHVLNRGAYDQPGDRVQAAVPAVLPAWSKDQKRDRLGLAKWLTQPKHPLTARVAVNQLWQQCFGRGLVRTAEDFGAQGEWPSHPALLDWLATEYTRLGWDTKAMLKRIVMSRTYRQSSRWTPAAEKDPQNVLLARGPRLRLSAEMIRDQALMVSGLLHEQLGGPSVKPYQPEGLWKEIASTKDYEQSKGADLYRRSLYTYIKRTVTPPLMATFDASPREACLVRQARTSTPLQALALMNDVTFVEAARVFAQQALSQAKTPEGRLRYLFECATLRKPAPNEMRILKAGLERHRKAYETDAEAAAALIAVGETPVPDKTDATELAAFTVVAKMILNLDEVITKQ